MYYFNEKRLVLVCLLLCHCLFLVSQEEVTGINPAIIRSDTITADTGRVKGLISPDAIDKTITYTARGYRRSNMHQKKVYLVEGAVVTYGDITLKADSIKLDMESSMVYATGRKDSTGKITGLPVFTQGSETFDSKEITINFKTGKARVMNMVTKQDEGFLHSGVTKKFDDGTLNISRSTYSTCELEHPHFYVGFNKAKVVPGKKIITGPAYLVLEDIPFPLVLPFGFFPIQKKTAESGIIIPKIGQTFELGYSAREGGYYFAINDNFDLAITGNVYTNGTYMLNMTSAYIKRYKYSGRISLSYASNVSGYKGLPNYTRSKNYRIDWTYNQDAKSHPGSRFAANVNMSSNKFDQQNSYIPEQHVNAQSQSSISYSKNWEGSPFNFSTSLNHSQNIRNKTMFLNLPKANFSMARIYPLKNRKKPGPAKWWQELQFQYNASVDNQINTYDSLLFSKELFKNMKSGFRHDAPLSMQIRPFRRIPGFSISPQLSYTGVLYTQKFEQRWIPDYFDPNVNNTVPSVVKDTVRGFFYGHSVNASVSAGISPQIFGTYEFKNPESRIRAVRHVIRPSIGFSYIPALKGLSTDMWRQVQIDTSGRTREYSIFDGNIYGTPSLSSRNGGITFSLVNIVEAKVLEKNDTTGKPKKVKIIDNLTMNTSYNIFADSLNWAPVSMAYRTVLFGNFSIAASSVFSMYASDESGRTINQFYLRQTGKPLRMTGLNMSFDFDVGQLFKKKTPGVSQQAPVQPMPGEEDGNPIPDRQGTGLGMQEEQLPADRYGYPEFDMPWTMRVAYSFYYTRQGMNPSISQTLSINGTLALTKKTNINYTTGFDVSRKEITMTSVGIQRDLHCWTMSMDWIPVGYMKSWHFTIRIKSSVLADLKYERRKDYHDNF